MNAELKEHWSLRVIFALTTTFFFLAMVLGLIQSLRSSHRLPPINSHYTPEINALIENENYENAIPHLERAISIDLENTAKNKTLLAKICSVVAQSRIASGDTQGALLLYEKAYAATPDATDILNNLAWFLATCKDASLRNGRRAVGLAVRADKAKPEDAATLDTLSAAYAEAGDFTNAVATQRKAIRLSPAASQGDLQSRLDLYLEGKPYHAP